MESNSATRRRNSSSSFEDSRDFDQILAEMGVFHAGFELNEDNSDIDGSIPTIGRGLGYNDETWIENDGHSKGRSIVVRFRKLNSSLEDIGHIYCIPCLPDNFLVSNRPFRVQTSRDVGQSNTEIRSFVGNSREIEASYGFLDELYCFRQDFGKIHAGIDRSAKNERKVELLDVVNYLKSFLLV